MKEKNKRKLPFGMANWQIAYLARELRHKKNIAFSCASEEAEFIINQLSFFCNSAPIMKNKTKKPGSNLVYLEVANAF